jgi:hypothetical protein
MSKRCATISDSTKLNLRAIPCAPASRLTRFSGFRIPHRVSKHEPDRSDGADMFRDTLLSLAADFRTKLRQILLAYKTKALAYLAFC